MLNLSVVLDDAVRETPERDAIVMGESRLSYAAVNAFACQIANLLRERGIAPGDKVALLCPNLPYFPMAYFGILKAGAVVVPLNVLFKKNEIAYHLDDSDAKALFCFQGTPGLPMGENGWAAFGETQGCEHFFLLPADPFTSESPIDGTELLMSALGGQPAEFGTTQTEPGDTAVILYTSGTTGKPKGAELTHQNMLMNAMVGHRLYNAAEHDIFLVALPLFHSFGQTVLQNIGFYRHATLILQPRFDATAALELMMSERVTLFAGVPTMYWGMLNQKAQHKLGLHTAISGGSPLPLEVLRGFEERFEVPILEGYGLSETSPIASFNRPDRTRKPGSVGLPIWGTEMKLIDEKGQDAEEFGEIAIRGHNIMKGYYKRPEATAEVVSEGWFRTGDIGRRDADGYYFIVDRSKDMLIRGGFNVYPREVEEVLMTHPEVSLAAVLGVPHEEHGEEIKAYIVRKPDATINEADLVAWAKENMAGFKYPRIVEFRDSLPMTATGKILKRELRTA